jgi:hypothetical protein
LVTSALVRAPELQNAEIKVHFSHQRIEVNTASSKRTSEKRLEILEKSARDWRFFLFFYFTDLASKLVKKRKI